MAMNSAAYFRRLARTGIFVLAGMLSLCGAAAAQLAVSTGSVIPLQHSNQYCQIFNVDIAPNGDALLLDVCGASQHGAIYQLKKGSTTFQTVASGIDTTGTYFNEGMAMDAKGTVYITDRYSSSQHIYRVPYNPADGTWDFSASGDSWEPMIDGGFEGGGTIGVAFLDSPAKDGSGTLFVSEQQNGQSIVVIPVNADGTVPTFPSGSYAGQPQFQYLIKGLKDVVMPMTVDVNGNLYFIENPYESTPANRATGIFFVPASAYTACASQSPIVPCINGTETSLQRIDPTNTEKFNGITLDAIGNVYVTETSDNYGGTTNGMLMIPNTTGNPVGVTATDFNFGQAQYLAPVGGNSNPTIDPRGFIWIPTGSSGNWTPNGSGAISGTGNFVLWSMGTANLGATPVGTPGTTGTVFFNFSKSVTPGSIALSQPGGGTDFSAVATNPNPPASGITPAVPCTAGTQYLAFSSCQYWVALNPQGANSVGGVSGQLSFLDSSNVIAGSSTYLSGVGEGPAVSLLIPVMQTPLATALVTPQQVAGDFSGNSYVADSGLGKVLMFAAGSTTASAGTAIGTGLTAPTGVAVDGSGDVYIADSGKVLEVPSVKGVLNAAGQTVLQSGLGSNVTLAVDGAGNVYAADPDNGRVVRIYNPQMSMLVDGTSTIGSGFTKPSAVAVDDAGDVFVADGTSLIEITSWGGQSTITNALSAPVTGLAVDPSGSVDVAQSGGILRIPFESTGLNFNDAAAIDSGAVTTPSGVGIDSLGNLYVTADSYTVNNITSSGPVTSNVTTPNVLLISNAFLNFGNVSTQTSSNPVDVNVFNIGNEPLAFTAAPTFAGTNAADYGIEQDGQNPCDTSGATPIASATACTLGVAATTANDGLSQASMTLTTNAVNAPSTNATLASWSESNLCRTATAITLTPATGLSYPGNLTVAGAVTALDPTCSPGNQPTGGQVVLTLEPEAKGAAESKQTQIISNGQASFNLANLNGGTYILFVSYQGDSIFGGSSSSRTYTVVVTQAIPTVTLNSPSGITPINGIYYVKQGSTTTLQASVTSTVGSPIGSVQFLNNASAPADTTQNPVTLDGSGAAIFNTANLPVANYSLTAAYGGDINFAATKSTAIAIDVIPPSALITSSPAAVTTPAGTAVTSALTITALEGYSPKAGAQLYCDNTTLPQYAECTFDVPTVDLFDHPGVPQVSNVTISSNLPVNVGELRRAPSPIAFAGMFGLGLLGLALRRRDKFLRSRLTVLCLVVGFAGALMSFTGCTNSSYTTTPPSPHVTTPSGTYNVRIYTVDLTTDQTSSLPFTLSVTIK
jgi:sugar lactone lactonase YvrE